MRTKLLFVIIFITLLWMPLIQMITGHPKITKVDENRMLSSFPELKLMDVNKKLLNLMTIWFEDHYGFRDFLIRLKTQLDYSLFGMSDKVYVGKDGWLFYRSVLDDEKPRVERLLKEKSFEVEAGIHRLAKSLRARNVELIVMINPMKDVVYGDYLPNAANRLANPREVEKLERRLKLSNDLIFIDSSAILKHLSLERNVYHKTDFHWNDPAAFEVSKTLVNKLAEAEGKSNHFWSYNLEIEKKKFSGGEAMFMPIFFPPKEQGLFVQKNWIDPKYTYIDRKPSSFQWIFINEDHLTKHLAPITVFGDSYFDGMSRSGFSNYFDKVYRMHSGEISLPAALNSIPSDSHYFLLEFIEVKDNIFLDLVNFK